MSNSNLQTGPWTTICPTREPIKIMADLLTAEEGIDPGFIMLGKKNYKIPPTPGLYVALFYGIEEQISNVHSTSDALDANGNFIGLLESEERSFVQEVAVDIMSFNDEARVRKSEIVQSLVGYNAQFLMGQYNIGIPREPRLSAPIEALEPAGQLNKFRYVIALSVLSIRSRAVPYYDEIPNPETTYNA